MTQASLDGFEVPKEGFNLSAPESESFKGKTLAAAGYDYAISMAEMGCLRMYMKWGLFDRIPRTQSISFKTLAQEGGIDEELATRIGRMLISTGKLNSPETGFVSHTPSSLEFMKDGSTGIIFRHFFDVHLTGWARWPAFFAKYGSNGPKDETHNPLAFANGADGHKKYWEVFADRGEAFIAEFTESMEKLQKVLPTTGIYDFTWVGRYAKDHAERPLIVDVGGGKGHSLRAILAETPEIPPARCILQDQGDVIQGVETSANDLQVGKFQKMVIDFHKDQPVKGALIYYLRHIIHDYQDIVCINILKHIADALPENEPCAKVLICEQIMSDNATPSPVTTAMDMAMLNIGAKERTEAAFEKIVTAAGLRLVKCHRHPGHDMGIVECSKQLG